MINSWYHIRWWNYLLLPFSWCFQGIVYCRRLLYRYQCISVNKISAPVIIVGNITVGGTGKTPLVIYLANYLQQQGYRPGIISRGYGSKVMQPQYVNQQSSASEVGDEPVLIVQHVDCPLVVSPNRVAAAQTLLRHHHCDIIISDDGLQHYALARDIEIAVIDGQRRLGNGFCLPTGPLREGKQRLAQVDFVVCNGNQVEPGEYMMQFMPQYFHNMKNSSQQALKAWQGKTVHAVAGVGNPSRFFTGLRELGLIIIEHPFADHHPFSVNDLFFPDDLPIVMTEKDAVKCRDFVDVRMWCLPVVAHLDKVFTQKLLEKISSKNDI
ncbi:MAG: tetraacyldisaccharide 4'-kinase [Gammaproteobacteria bacterium]|nr:tetraacyldisaccharide 4'-kinase [Gammaproteobacteria bacterium]